ncbi:hypothetical protein DFP72DRAFT_569557 [Ephemerocybe angulata]|uniref:Uncharacterized protein n=1 Tax=Ephemerocybe angulata TaxID=980116 RepID=A0A8H6MEH5_9AGAR|nr:hypothetical protein DFP72DRAFT_569557 [Tulosesus angulatus]
MSYASLLSVSCTTHVVVHLHYAHFVSLLLHSPISIPSSFTHMTIIFVLVLALTLAAQFISFLRLFFPFESSQHGLLPTHRFNFCLLFRFAHRLLIVIIVVRCLSQSSVTLSSTHPFLTSYLTFNTSIP